MNGLIKPTKKKVLTFGRYNPFKIGHLCAINDLLEHWDEVVVGVINNNTEIKIDIPKLGLEEYCKIADVQNAKIKNHFDLEERMLMINASIDHNRVKVVPLDRPEYNPDDILSRFPDTEYDIAFSDITDNEFDRMRNCIMPQILKRSIFLIPPSFVLHNSDIKKSITASEDWAKHMPYPTYKIFLSINGYSRMNSWFSKKFHNFIIVKLYSLNKTTLWKII